MQFNAFVCRRVAVFRIILSSFRSTLPYPLWKYIADLGNSRNTYSIRSSGIFRNVASRWNVVEILKKRYLTFQGYRTLNFFLPPLPENDAKTHANPRSHWNIWRVIKISSYEKFKVSSKIVPSLSISSNDVWKMIVAKWSWLFIIPFFFFL